MAAGTPGSLRVSPAGFVGFATGLGARRPTRVMATWAPPQAVPRRSAARLALREDLARHADELAQPRFHGPAAPHEPRFQRRQVADRYVRDAGLAEELGERRY